jgi:hypothetical protein
MTIAKPKSLKDLVPYLTENPMVCMYNLDGSYTEETFLREEASGLWFRRVFRGETKDHFLPVNCRLSDAAAKHEAGVTFDDAGFTLTKFGKSIRVDYQSE